MAQPAVTLPRVGVAALVVGLWAALAVLPAVDAAILAGWVAARTAGMTTLAIGISDIGGTVEMAVLAVVAGAWCWRRGRRVDAMFVIGAMAGSALVFRLLKMLFDRPRPPVATRLVVETSESLPSGHATMSLVVIGALVVLAWGRSGVIARTVMVAVAAMWCAAVGATRVYLGVHWFSDVVTGWLVGAAWLAVCVALWRRRIAAAAVTSP